MEEDDVGDDPEDPVGGGRRSGEGSVDEGREGSRSRRRRKRRVREGGEEGKADGGMDDVAYYDDGIYSSRLLTLFASDDERRDAAGVLNDSLWQRGATPWTPIRR